MIGTRSFPRRPHLVVLTGAGVSVESGLATFRGADSKALWGKFDPMKVATPEAWAADPALVLEFYNLRRQQVRAAKPNAAHQALAKLEDKFDVSIVTQNVDDLHERAGSSKVLHLHGEIMKARSTLDSSCVLNLGEKDIELGDLCPRGGQLRPHIVWFGEMVPAMEKAEAIAEKADILVVIGTSLTVYPAASLVHLPASAAPRYLIDPEAGQLAAEMRGTKIIAKSATEGTAELVEQLLMD